MYGCKLAFVPLLPVVLFVTLMPVVFESVDCALVPDEELTPLKP
jgi:hypothetical protein